MLPKKWSQWTIVPIGFLLVAAIVGAGFGLVKAVQASLPDAEAVASYISTYEVSMSNPDVLAYPHAQEGLGCVDCHLSRAEEAIAKFTADGSAEERMTGMDVCFDCHVDNEHTSYEQVIERTKDYVMLATFQADEDTTSQEDCAGAVQVILEERNINPHDAHLNRAAVGDLECQGCHRIHEQSPLIDACYSCHHNGTLLSCSLSDCHPDMAITEGGE